jgi:hypothetical protein
MPIPIWSIGQVLAASDVNSWFVAKSVVKTANTSYTSTTTLANDPDLVVPVAANSQYIVTAFLLFQAAHTVAGDLKWDFTIPASATFTYQVLHNEGGGSPLNNSVNQYLNTTVGFAAGQDAANSTLTLWGTVITGATAGNVQWRIAQQTSNTTATIIRNSSFLKLDKAG